jgi:hypothetical protein
LSKETETDFNELLKLKECQISTVDKDNEGEQFGNREFSNNKKIKKKQEIQQYLNC